MVASPEISCMALVKDHAHEIAVYPGIGSGNVPLQSFHVWRIGSAIAVW
jgi:hypothetical protein